MEAPLASNGCNNIGLYSYGDLSGFENANDVVLLIGNTDEFQLFVNRRENDMGVSEIRFASKLKFLLQNWIGSKANLVLVRGCLNQTEKFSYSGGRISLDGRILHKASSCPIEVH